MSLESQLMLWFCLLCVIVYSVFVCFDLVCRERERKRARHIADKLDFQCCKYNFNLFVYYLVHVCASIVFFCTVVSFFLLPRDMSITMQPHPYRKAYTYTIHTLTEC